MADALKEANIVEKHLINVYDVSLDYSFTKKEFRQMEKLADYIYNIAVVLDYFCSTQREIEELYNLTPIIKDLRRLSDTLNCIFINYDSEEDDEKIHII